MGASRATTRVEVYVCDVAPLVASWHCDLLPNHGPHHFAEHFVKRTLHLGLQLVTVFLLDLLPTKGRDGRTDGKGVGDGRGEVMGGDLEEGGRGCEEGIKKGACLLVHG